jgi:stearoyl-CoA desaturase (delta-9 desaturase)
MRFWLWLTTGMITREWVAVHRLHHHTCETHRDPHSPHVHGLWRVLLGGAWLYNDAARDQRMVDQLSRGTPDDWIERNLYRPHHKLGFVLLLALDLAMFGAWGALIWGIQMIWIPFWAAGVINGVGHAVGYRVHDTPDQSRNIVPWGIIIGGEELHNGHHANPASARLSQRWWEFDIGYFYIRLLEIFGLAVNVNTKLNH